MISKLIFKLSLKQRISLFKRPRGDRAIEEAQKVSLSLILSKQEEDNSAVIMFPGNPCALNMTYNKKY